MLLNLIHNASAAAWCGFDVSLCLCYFSLHVVKLI